jgi:hypothetical protein
MEHVVESTIYLSRYEGQRVRKSGVFLSKLYRGCKGFTHNMYSVVNMVLLTREPPQDTPTTFFLSLI